MLHGIRNAGKLIAEDVRGARPGLVGDALR